MKHFAPISGIASFAEQYVATAGYDNQVILWDAQTRQAVHRVFHDHLANQCAFNAAGTRLVSASSDYTARVWDVPSMRLRTALVGHRDDVEMAAFDPSGERVATCSRDHTLRVFDAENGTCLQILEGHDADVISLSWSADGHTLVSSSDDGSIRRWNVHTGAEVERIDLGGVETDTIALASDGTIFAGDDDGRLTVIDAQGKTSIQAHAAGVKRVVWDERKRWLISLSYDRSVVLWRYEGGTLVRLAHSSLPSVIWPRSCAFLGDRRIAFVTFGSTYAIWDHVADAWNLDGIDHAISLNAVSIHDGHTYAIGDAGKLLIDGTPSTLIGSLCNFLLPFGEEVLTGGQMGQVYDAVSGRLIHQHRSPLNCATCFTRDGVPHAAVGTYTGEALIFRRDAQGQAEFVREVAMHDNAIKGISADEDYLFSVCATAAAAFHRISDFSLARHVEQAHDRISNGCATVHGGFASVGRDLKLRIWAGEQSQVYETPHLHSVKCIAASADRQVIATGSYGGTVALFDLKQRCWTRRVKPTTSGISCITWSAQQGAFLASSYDGQLYPISVSA
ncbi:WD40 repeat domain-containing protein [Pseudomonas sp. S75]|uniref:WD40 repeat domain-containing protein n=1 Tax=unclassified Pseudomonas TaxID=196821 RepID=UPI001907E519|nr:MULTISPECIES: WD40 repeat domain-containing protein [unclassified Pseudomonas]MBJ9977088.1 WD40 repeat domain-containing protein [Pseudomonas sp. S30]MBK0154090.1 WD40 repeat domain-containing protein [Pseudomonas sp. S75]